MSNTQKQTPKKPEPAGLRGKKYTALFRSDLRPEVIPFTVDGKSCSVSLLPMGKDSRNYYLTLAQDGDGDIDLVKALNHLVDSTVIGFSIWRRATLADGTHGEWEECTLPDGEKPSALLSGELEPMPGFWDDLLAECQRVNGFVVETAGN